MYPSLLLLNRGPGAAVAADAKHLALDIEVHPVERIDKDRPDVIVVLPWNLETEITKQLSYVGEWGAQLVYPLPELHFAAPNEEMEISK